MRSNTICRECNGCGCPSCLGFGVEVSDYIKQWGLTYGLSDLKAQDFEYLEVTKQRLLKEYIVSKIY